MFAVYSYRIQYTFCQFNRTFMVHEHDLYEREHNLYLFQISHIYKHCNAQAAF